LTKWLGQQVSKDYHGQFCISAVRPCIQLTSSVTAVLSVYCKSSLKHKNSSTKNNHIRSDVDTQTTK